MTLDAGKAMLIGVSRNDVPALDASYELVELRTPHLRVLRSRSRRLVSDYGLLNKAAPFLHRMRHASLTVLLEGEGRFEENGRRRFLRPGNVVFSDMRRGGTEAYGGVASTSLAIEWEPGVNGGAFAGSFAIERLSTRDMARIGAAASQLDGPDPRGALAEIVAVLQSAGAMLDGASIGALDLVDAPPTELQQLQSLVAHRLSALDEYPTVEDLVVSLGWNERRIHRRMAELSSTYRTTWETWRDAVRRARILHAIRLLAVPSATTELVARLAGFRAPTALCHAFAEAGLPSPGRLAHVAKHDALARWGEVFDELGDSVTPQWVTSP